MSASTPTDTLARLGFQIWENVFSESEVRELRDEAERVVRRLFEASLAAREWHPLLDVHVAEPRVPIVRSVGSVLDLSGRFRRVAEDDRILGRVRRALECDVELIDDKLNCKQPLPCPQALPPELHASHPAHLESDAWALHHDWGYYREVGCPTKGLTCAIAIDPPHGRGALTFIPGSHTRHTALIDPDPANGVGRADPTRVSRRRMAFEAAPGSLAAFDLMLLHESAPNPTAYPRRQLIFAFAAKTLGSETRLRDLWAKSRRAAAAAFARDHPQLPHPENPHRQTPHSQKPHSLNPVGAT